MTTGGRDSSRSKAAGGHVRRGEHGHWICIMRTVSGSRPADGADAELDAMTGDSRADGSRGRRTREYTYTTFRPVWNAAQCENIAPVEDDDADAPRSDRRIAAGEAYTGRGRPAEKPSA